MDTGLPNHIEGILKKRPLPSFVKKLWFIMGDISCHEHIFWVDQGQVICVPNASAFSKTILPRFFKHSNWQSFVRQLNLYGFRKVYQLNLSYDESAEKRTVWQFKHEWFRKGQPEKLCEIKRRAPKHIPPSTLQGTVPKLTMSSSLPNNNDSDQDTVEDKLGRFAKRLQHVDNKRKELREQTIKLNEIQVRQQKVIHVLMDFMMQFLEKHPDSGNDKIRFENIKKKITEQETFVDMDTTSSTDDDEEDMATSSTSPIAIHAFPSPPLIHQTPLPPISALMANHPSDILPPLRKKTKY